MAAHFFPLAIISDEVSQDLDRVIAFAKEFHLEGIEIRSLFGRAFKDLTVADVRQIGSRTRNEGLKIPSCSSPVFKCDLDRPSEIAAHVDIFKSAVEKAMAWNCDLIRVFTFLRKNGPPKKEDLKRVASHFPKLLEAVKGAGIRIGVENEYSTLVASGKELSTFLGMVNNPGVGSVWDPCNVLFLPDAKDPVELDYPLIEETVFHVHFKDATREKGKPADRCVQLGKGEVKFQKQLDLLKKRKYKGWVSLETHWRTQQALSSQSTHLPAGHAFSSDAEPASRICMKQLIEWVDGL